jgi:hypothetical protein
MVNAALKALGGAGVKVVRHLTGSYVTSLEMAGCSITVSAVDAATLALGDVVRRLRHAVELSPGPCIALGLSAAARPFRSLCPGKPCRAWSAGRLRNSCNRRQIGISCFRYRSGFSGPCP